MDEKKTRTTKEYQINKGETFRVKYGTLDKNNPEVIYLRTKAKIKPFIEKRDYSNDVQEIKDDFMQYIKDVVKYDYFLNDRHICSFSVSEKGLAYGKGSHIKYDLYVKPLEVKPIQTYEQHLSVLVRNANNKLISMLEQHGINCE